MKKRLLATLLSSTLVMTSLAGCSSKSENGDMVTELTKPITIEMWHYMNGGQAEVLNEIIEDFNATNDKGITVNAISQGSIVDLNKKVISAAQSNSLPAIINVYPDVATGLIEDKKLVNLSSFINDKNVGMADEMGRSRWKAPSCGHPPKFRWYCLAQRSPDCWHRWRQCIFLPAKE